MQVDTNVSESDIGGIKSGNAANFVGAPIARDASTRFRNKWGTEWGMEEARKKSAA